MIGIFEKPERISDLKRSTLSENKVIKRTKSNKFVLITNL